jgi:hypothetical protein
MRVFGPLPNLWEGGGQGEKVLQLVKPLWNGFRSRWHVNLLDRVLNDMALKRLFRSTMQELSTSDEELEDSCSNTVANGMYVAYRDVAEVKRKFRQRRCMSVVFLSTGDAGFMIYQRAAVGFHPLLIGDVVSNKLGITYFELTVSEAHLPVLLEMTGITLEQHCIILPQLRRTGMPVLNECTGWAIINNKWQSYDSTHHFEISRM